MQEDFSGQEQPEPGKPIEAVKIFYCYDRIDRPYLVELEKRLKPLKDKFKFTTWWGELINAGTDRNHELMKQLKESSIVLLLVSPDFLISSECRMIEQQAMELHKAEKIFRIIPIRIRPVDFQHEGFYLLQSLPKDGEPISERRQKDRAWVEVQRGIIEVVNEYFTQPQQASDVRNGFIFIGFYPTQGFHWDTELRPAPGLVKQEDLPDFPWLVSAAVGIRELSQRYSLFREKTILRDFALLSPTTDDIKGFADRYGYLGELVPLIYPDKVGILWAGEALQYWTEQIEEMNRVVTIWGMVQNRQVEALKAHVIWKSDPHSILFIWRTSDGTFKRGTVIASENIKSPLFYQFEWGEVIRPALSFLLNEIQQKLEGNVSPKFFPAQQKIYMVPDNLLSALYLLLLLEIQDHEIEPES